MYVRFNLIDLLRCALAPLVAAFLLVMPLAQAAITPTDDFTDNGDGSVTHRITGLTWKRCTEGMAWSGSICNGTAKIYTWDQAVALGSDGWVLPTIEQLRTIVDSSNRTPAINTAIFPGTPASIFWSASAHAGSSDFWNLNFSNGLDNSYDLRTSSYYVRLVRGATPADCIFNWAEKNYPQVFLPGAGKTKTLGEYYYRQYPGNVYLGASSKDNHVYYLIGEKMADAGPVSQLNALSGCE